MHAEGAGRRCGDPIRGLVGGRGRVVCRVRPGAARHGVAPVVSRALRGPGGFGPGQPVGFARLVTESPGPGFRSGSLAGVGGSSAVTLSEFLGAVVARFERCSIAHVVGGSIASSVEGETRTTRGADIVVEVTRHRCDGCSRHSSRYRYTSIDLRMGSSGRGRCST
jgi:hypothetical protein